MSGFNISALLEICENNSLHVEHLFLLHGEFVKLVAENVNQYIPVFSTDESVVEDSHVLVVPKSDHLVIVVAIFGAC